MIIIIKLDCTYTHPKMCRMALTTGRCDRKKCFYHHKTGTIGQVPNKPTPGPTRPTNPFIELNIPPYPSCNHKVIPPLTSTSQFHQQNPTTNQPQAQATRWDLSTAPKSLIPSTTCQIITNIIRPNVPQLKLLLPRIAPALIQLHVLFRSNESNQTAHVRHAASPKQIASDHESSMAMFARSKGQLNPVNQPQPLMYSFILLNIARLFTKSKPKVKLLHDLCTPSTLFIFTCFQYTCTGELIVQNTHYLYHDIQTQLHLVI